MRTPAPGRQAAQRAEWERLRRLVLGRARQLSAPPPRSPWLCPCCRGPVGPGWALCYQCESQARCLPGLLPDAVAPIAYAPKGGGHARDLWLYKSSQPGARAARDALGALLMVFLRDHGECVWNRAGIRGPTHAAVVPSGRGRQGTHPLRALAGPCLRLPWAEISPGYTDDQAGRAVSPERFLAQRLPGADVLLLDDTWTTGASCRSAAAALKLAGARSVAVVVLGRHIGPDREQAATPACADPAAGSAGMAFTPDVMPFLPGLCAVHGVPPGSGPPQSTAVAGRAPHRTASA